MNLGINFPNNVDSFVKKYDPTSAQTVEIKNDLETLKNLQSKSNLSDTEKTTYINTVAKLSAFLFSADDYNKLCDCILALEQSIMNAKSVDTNIYIDTSISSITSPTIPIRLKNGTITYVKETDALVVYCNDVLLVENDDYTISETSDSNGDYSIIRTGGNSFYATTDYPLCFKFIIIRKTYNSLVDYKKKGINYVYKVSSVDELDTINAIEGDVVFINSGGA